MMNFPPSWKRDQVFISFRGKTHRANFVSFLKQELERSGINYYVDENGTRGLPMAILFQRIRESGVALIIFSAKYPESCWCLNELVEIKNQMEIGSVIPFPVFYNLKVNDVKKQTGWFGNHLLITEDRVRKNVDRGSNKSILETETTIWRRREALASVGGATMALSHKRSSDMVFLRELVVKLKKLLDKISSPRNIQTVIQKLLIHPQEAVTSLLQALNLRIPDLKDLITKTSIHSSGLDPLSDDHLVFLDLNSLKNPALAHRLIKTGQSGKILLVLLGSLEDVNESLTFTPLLFPKKPQKYTGNKLLSSSQEIHSQSSSLPVQVTNCSIVFETVESNDNLQNLPGQDNNSDDTLTCFSLLCNIVNCFAMIISPPFQGVSISFGEKQLGESLVSSLKTQLKSNRFSVPEASEMNERIKESKVAIVVFSAKYPDSQQCLDELVEIKKLMDAKEINPFPIFYKLEDESVRELKSRFLLRLLKIEYQVRKNVNRRNEKAILDAEAKIWGWRQALKSIASEPGLSYRHSDDTAFASDIVTKVKELFACRERKPNPTSSNTTTHPVFVEETPMPPQETAAITTVQYNDKDLFYSPSSFLQALNLETTDIEGFNQIPNGLASLSLKGHANLVFLSLSSLDDLVQFQHSDSFQFLQKGLAMTPSGVNRIEEPSRILALEPNRSKQWSDNRLIASDQDHHSNHFPAQIHNDTNLEGNMFFEADSIKRQDA
ncbi:hypothetical protein Bca52824_090808 [Brassica carinata]|uniref:TIR domain-containing protein n=1 Tax=Brassica carinata TaxID=52824 RepID=A0A8X7NXP6_BRACI|nr:hypothetical protein Bca52824_090808 [Brassica carinata]